MAWSADGHLVLSAGKSCVMSRERAESDEGGGARRQEQHPSRVRQVSSNGWGDRLGRVKDVMFGTWAGSGKSRWGPSLPMLQAAHPSLV